MRKQLIFGILILLQTFCDASIIDDQGNPTQEVKQIVKSFCKCGPLAHVDPIVTKALMDKNTITRDDLYRLLQENFLRPKGAERLSEQAIAHYKILSSSLQPTDQERIINLFRKIGHIDKIEPHDPDIIPQAILIQGSLVSTMKERIHYLASVVKENKLKIGVETRIIFQAGERNLTQGEQNELKEYTDQLVVDEREIGKILWNSIELPEQFRQLKPEFMTTLKKSSEKRAQTEDCIVDWLNQNKLTRGTYYVVSSNPFIFYQQSLINYYFRKGGFKEGFIVIGIGNKLDLMQYTDHLYIIIGILMDNLARTFYITQMYRTNKI